MDCDGGVAVGVRIVELPSQEASQGSFTRKKCNELNKKLQE